jgi:hypothetical protein
VITHANLFSFLLNLAVTDTVADSCESEGRFIKSKNVLDLTMSQFERGWGCQSLETRN